MHAFLLTLLGASQLPAAAPQSTSETELGTVEFAAGPARGSARFYLAGTEPQVEVRIHNDSALPIWWRGEGIGCVESAWLVPPRSLTSERPPFGCTGIVCSLEKSATASLAFLARNAIAPFHASEPWIARPFYSDWDDQLVSVPPLDRWAWRHELTLPRALPPLHTMDFECPEIVLAWSRATGPRVFLSRGEEFGLERFDPFADEPFQRGLGPFLFQCGPLHGSIVLRPEPEQPIVEWTLINPSAHAVQWSPRGVGPDLRWGFRELDIRSSEHDPDASAYPLEQDRAQAPSIPGAESRFAPGETKRGTIAPFSFDPSGRPARPPELHGLRRWHFVLGSTWPRAEQGTGAPRFLPTRLHLYWDEERGFDAALLPPEGLGSFGDWRPFQRVWRRVQHSSSFRFGELEAVLEFTQWTDECRLVVRNETDMVRHWLPISIGTGVWLQVPGEVEATVPLAQEPEDWTKEGSVFPLRFALRVELIPGEWETLLIPLDRLQPVLEPAWEPVCELPWEALLPVALPQEHPPAHDRDARRGWLRVRWDPERGLDVRLHETWPF